MKKLLIVLFAVCVVSSLAFGQWTAQGSLTSATPGWPAAYGQGCAVDGAGKIWYTPYYNSDSVWVAEHHDTTAAGEDTTILAQYNNCRAIYVFNPDGSEASFSRIKILTVDGNSDTLWNSARGLRTDPNGDIVAGSWIAYYRINHLTGEGMQFLVPYPRENHQRDDWDGESVCAAAFDDEGNMFTCTVLPGFPLKAFDDVWDYIDDVVAAENHSAYSRTMEISGDGNDIYYCGFSAGYAYYRFHSDAGLDGDYTTRIDTLLPGGSVESVSWQPVTGYLWGGQTGTAGTLKAGCFYALDVTTDLLVDSIIVDTSITNLGVKPRGMGFSADGETAYLTYFNSWDNEAVYVFTKGPGGIWEHTNTMAVGYELKQNYPNPFNAATVIPFRIDKAADVKLTVYDMVGNEVRTLVDEKMDKGSYNIDFDATGLATGMYVYRLETNGLMFSKKMMFVK
ncbi:MAG: T9SS type A sorting domain-containing protein [Candidatus Marinimicrobia bacterium]|nr:T9SS type A sorting domain-containing protein [Candidatus Neomarinimicrobiota bacterium]